MTNVNQEVGALGEQLAADHLASAGMVLLARNWRCALGEIDIIARDGDALVFCEVKTRRGTAFGSPAESVGALKVRRLRRLAARWLATSGIRAPRVRFDVVSVCWPRVGDSRIEHLRDVF